MVAAKNVRALAQDAARLAAYIVETTRRGSAQHKAAERILANVKAIRIEEEKELAKKQEELRLLKKVEADVAYT